MNGVSYTLTHKRTENVLRKRILEWNYNLLSCSRGSHSSALYQFPDKRTELSLLRSHLFNKATDWERSPAGEVRLAGAAQLAACMGLAGEKDAWLPAVGRLGVPQTLLTATAIYGSLSPLKRPGRARRPQQGRDMLRKPEDRRL